ncbi:MAG: CotS family spore coat protein [Eubacteriales bacterium]
MIENLQKIIEQYGYKLINSYRGRGAYICETNKGIKLLKEMETTIHRTWFEYYVKKHLIENGYTNVDQFILHNKKPYFEKDDKKYIFKNWCNGHECDLFNEMEILMAVENLARLHKVLQNVEFYDNEVIYSNLGDLPSILKRHANELKKVRKFIRNQSHWSDFDILFLKNYNYYYKKASDSLSGFEETNYYGLVKKAKQKQKVCHGEYTQHNVIITKEGLMTINFEKSCMDLQIMDFYQFIRKVMEKNNWNYNLGMKMIDTYNKKFTLERESLKVLYYSLLYPEKFWKISNYYFNTRKAWNPKRSLEKMEKLIGQQNSKDQFLNYLKNKI